MFAVWMAPETYRLDLGAETPREKVDRAFGKRAAVLPHSIESAVIPIASLIQHEKDKLLNIEDRELHEKVGKILGVE